MSARADHCFILVDALLAAAIVSFAGTVVLTIVVSAHERSSRELDRSVALVTMHSLAMQFPMLTIEQRPRLEAHDELFRYAISQVVNSTADLGSLTEWRVTATPLVRGEPLNISFLAP